MHFSVTGMYMKLRRLPNSIFKNIDYFYNRKKERESAMQYHALNMGTIVSNLHSLEFSIRNYLSYFDEGSNGLVSLVSGLKKGDVINLDSVTDFRTLSQLIEDYNNKVKAIDDALFVDANFIVPLRDAIAHGRVIYPYEDPHPILAKFSKPAKGRDTVTVEYYETLNDQWFDCNRSKVHGEVMKVVRALDIERARRASSPPMTILDSR